MQTRREFLRSTSLALTSLSAMSMPSGGCTEDLTGRSSKRSPPNVVFIQCDQLNAKALSCYGGEVDTPNIERLAKEGVKFSNAVCVTPFCSPSRATWITGMYPHTHGIVANVHDTRQQGITDEDITTEKILSNSGYAAHHYGKWHLRTVPSYYPDMYRLEDEYPQEMEPVFTKVRQMDKDKWMDWYQWDLPVTVSDAVKENAKNLKLGIYHDFIAKMGKLELPVEQNCDVRICDKTVDRIRACKDHPFMLTCSFNYPHDPNVVPSPYYDMFDPDKVTLAENRHVREKRFEKDWSRHIVAALKEPGLREFIRIYYGMVKLIDDQVGRILKTLEETGQLENTVIIFTADHGDMMSGHGMVWKSTHSFYDEIVRVPLMIRYPKLFKAQICDMAVDFTDFMPTILALTDRPIPKQAQGQNLVPYLTGQKDLSQARQYAFSERVTRHKQGLRKVAPGTKASFCVRGQGFKYCKYPGQEFLYDLQKDPGEEKDCAKDPLYKDRLDIMRTELANWLKQTNWTE
ncbi:MAG: sulfatase family protein [Planctomycetota bacterium]